ncbi:MAG: N-acetylmuramoyl-L-alanine amidase, partial [Chitinophagaceae bacterium]|nr:N-acetylmuramoyl-L-alanine amidase [Chitinophagaceae bacterium]
MKMLIYIGQVTLVSALLYGYYHLFLRNRSFHCYNRCYLLMACVLSLLLPCITIPVSWSTSGETAPAMVRLLETVYVDAPEKGEGVVSNVNTVSANAIDWPFVASVFYWMIAGFFLLRLIYSLIKLRRLASQHPSETIGKVRLIRTNAPGTPFSIFNLIFWNNELELQSAKGRQIFRHELTHIKQKHSYDVFFTELITILCWINPFFHLMRKEIGTIHEFLADEPATTEDDRADYAELLLMHSLRTTQPLVNPFFHNQIKRRIAMITEPKITRSRYARQLMILPIAAVLFGLVAFRLKPVSNASGRNSITVVVDAGHGGFDPGAKSPDQKTDEASMTLDFATTMHKLAPEYGINVVLTRENENAVGATKQEDLKNRVAKTREAKPALFLSFHINTSHVKDKAGFQENLSGIE